MCVRKSGAGDTLVKREVALAKIGKVSGGEEREGQQEHEATCLLLDSGGEEAKLNGGSLLAVGNGHGMHQGQEKVVVPNETNLSGVLDSLISLDPRGDFMGPLDGFSAPNHSKVIEAPMCFAIMQEKIRTQQYSTWRVFVGDFERICYNALRCNQKRSIIWAAADDLLRRGKKRLEQYEGLGESLVALNKTGRSLDSKALKSKSENVDARVSQDDDLSSVVSKMAITSVTTDFAEGKTSSSGAAAAAAACLIQKRLKEEDAPFLAPMLDVVAAEEKTILDEEDVDVEGESEDLKPEDHRLDHADGDATETSSSYGSAGSAVEGETDSEKMFEAESHLRDGNGAVGLLEDDDGVPMSERGKKALDTEWKQYRRGIEWRCRWLELRTQAIKAQIGLYDKLLRSAQSEKIWNMEGAVGDGASARTVPVKILRNHQIIHRKRRKRAEDALDLDLGRHPVFSRYEKKKIQRKSDDGLGSAQEKVDGQQAQQTDFEIAEPEASVEKENVDQAFVGHDSMEQLLWQVEALQVRVKKQKHLLKKEAAGRKTSGGGTKANNVALPRANSVVPSPKARVGPPSSSSGSLGRTGPGSGLARRRASDYDINNMVMPVNVGATFVEHVRHVDIETPLWRLLEDDAISAAVPGSSSDEDSDEEQYTKRHAVMEALERQHRYMPRLKKSSGDIHTTVGKGKLKLGIGKSSLQMAGKGARLSLPSGPAPIVVRSADNVPKRQRSNRNTARRVVPQVDSTAAAQLEAVKSEAPAEPDDDVNPLGAEIGGTTTKAEMRSPKSVDEE